jgi:fatty-acyl-CoA synthase
MEMKHPDFAARDLSSLRTGLISGYVPPNELFDEIEQKFPGMWFCNFWGSSETGPSLISPHDAPRSKRYFTVGKCVPCNEAGIADPATGELLPDGAPGEIVIRGETVINGYWRNDGENALQFDADGYLHTGDLGVRDAQGYITIVGRLKDQINRGGFKIVPSDVERSIAKHPSVDQVCVVGTPNPVLGESVCACIISHDGEPVDVFELREFLSDKLARNKLPDEVCMMSSFPRLSGGVKIKKIGEGGMLELAANAPRQSARDKKATVGA